MKNQFIIFFFISLIFPAFQQPEYECVSIENPSKEQCNNISPLNTECCFVETTSFSFCGEYDPDLINYDYYVADQLKENKTNLIVLYLQSHDVALLETSAIISDLESMLMDTKKIYCNTFTKEIDYSAIEYSEDDIAKAKQDNFCGKLKNEDEVSEEQCLNGVVFSDLAGNGEKCCYTEISSEENEYKFTQCLSLSQSQRDNEKYLESLIDGFERPFTVKIICDGFSLEKSYPSSSSESEDTSNEVSENKTCEEVNNPSKETCNNINILNSECCYENLYKSPGEILSNECKIYDPSQINYEGFEEDQIKDTKILFLANKLLNNEEIPDEEIIGNLDELNYKINIDCKTFSKTIDYSKIKFTKEDVEIGKKNNFCGKLIYEDEVTENQCINGVTFSDLEVNGEKCCYATLYSLRKDPIITRCFSLSKTQRENINSIKYLLPSIEEDYIVEVACDEFRKVYISKTEEWVEEYMPPSDQLNDNDPIEICENVNNPLSKEQCTNINILNSECCFIKVYNDSSKNSHCQIISPEEINYDSFEDDQLNYFKFASITAHLEEIEDIDDYNEIIKKLNEYIKLNMTIECNTFSKIIDYSKINFTKEDIEISKKDNFCGKLMEGKEASEEICSNGIVLADLAAAGEKCCYFEAYSEKNDFKYSECISLSQADRENDKYLVSLSDIQDMDYPSRARIVCNGYEKTFSYIDKEWVEETQESICGNIKNPSKDKCNKFEISNSKIECCYVESTLSSETMKYCEEHKANLPNIDGYEQVLLNQFKIELILDNIQDKETITDYNTFISELKSQIPKTKTISCKTSSKSLDFSKITITQEDIINAQKDNFCPKLEKSINTDMCLSGVLFSDFSSAGGQCCYLEVNIQEQNQKEKKCVALSKLQRDNKSLINYLIKDDDSLGKYIVFVICDGFKEKYDSSTGQWTTISESSSSSSFFKNKNNFNLSFILLLILILLS